MKFTVEYSTKQIDAASIKIQDDLWLSYFYTLDDDDTDLDPKLEPMRHELEKLQVHCVSMCCGFGAFEFSKTCIAARLSKTEIQNLKFRSEKLLKWLQWKEDQSFSSLLLNQVGSGRLFQNLFGHLYLQCDALLREMR